MTAFMLQSALFMLVAYFAGCFLGCLARRTLFGRLAGRLAVAVPASRPMATAAVAGGTAGHRFGGASEPMTRFERALSGASPAAGASAAPVAVPVSVPVAAAVPVAPIPAAAAGVAAQIPAAAAAAAAAVAAVAARAAQNGNSMLPSAMGSSGPATVTANVTPAVARPVPAADPAPVVAAVQASSAGTVPAAPASAVAAAADVPPPVSSGMHDLTRIRAIDGSLQASLKGLGVSSYADIAAWKPADVTRISGALKMPGRIEQENWIEQAQILAKGGETYYSRRKGKGEEANSRPTPDEGERITVRVPAATRATDAPLDVPPGTPSSSVSSSTTTSSTTTSSTTTSSTTGGAPAAAAPTVDLKAAAATAAAAVQAAQAAVAPRAVAAIATVAAAATAAAASTQAAAAAAAAPAAPVLAAPVTAVPAGQAIASASAASAGAASAPVIGSARDSLQRIAGINGEVERLLNVQGVTRYSQIAGWSPSDVSRFDRLLGFEGRIARENWIEQANILAKGGETAFARDLARRETDASRPAKLADAIQSNAPAVATVAEPGPKAELSNLRSVRSEAYRGGDPLPPAGRGTDDLKRIRGVGVLIEKKLNALGVSRYDQVANWTRSDIERFSDKLDFKGRSERENWVEQARILSAGGQTEFSQRVDRGEVETSKPG